MKGPRCCTKWLACGTFARQPSVSATRPGVIPAASCSDLHSVSPCDGSDACGLFDQGVPGVAAGVNDGVVGGEHPGC